MIQVFCYSCYYIKYQNWVKTIIFFILIPCCSVPHTWTEAYVRAQCLMSNKYLVLFRLPNPWCFHLPIIPQNVCRMWNLVNHSSYRLHTWHEYSQWSGEVQCWIWKCHMFNINNIWINSRTVLCSSQWGSGAPACGPHSTGLLLLLPLQQRSTTGRRQPSVLPDHFDNYLTILDWHRQSQVS